MRAVHPEVMASRPGCFTDAEWERWRSSEQTLVARGCAPSDAGFCAACTGRYKYRMTLAGKCRHENVVFVPDEDGDMVGVRPDVGPVLCHNGDSTSEET